MKTTYSIIKNLFLIITCMVITSCVDLAPDPLSFYTSENITTKKDLDALLVNSRLQIKYEWYGDAFNAGSCETPIVYEYGFSDISVIGSPETKEIHNLETQLTPTTNMKLHLRYWDLGWKGIAYANSVISDIPTVKFSSEQEKNEVLSEAYFHRSYWYYLLTNQWGNVPLSLEAIKSAKVDYQTASRTTILNQMKADMEFAVQWLPLTVQPGAVNRAAGEHLLTKIYLALGEFENAVASATRCIDNYGLKLMKDRFGANVANTQLDVFNDLFNENNISSPENKEAIFVIQERFGLLGNVAPSGCFRMRNFVPYWSNGSAVRTPENKAGTTYASGQYNGRQLVDTLGRGIAKIRPSNFGQYELWNNCGTDLRHNDNNWYDINKLWYNEPKAGIYFGKTVERQYVTDTVRCYFSFPKVKVLIYKDEINVGKTPYGGFTDSYVFRLAETYLMRAEAYWWLNDARAKEDVNEIRRRAKAPELTTVTLDDVVDERARELYIEEHRKVELTRIAFLMAKLGKDGYALNNFSEKNWYYDRVMAKNNFYKTQYYYSTNAYVMKPYHVLWPIPQDDIEANTQGRINQNVGYPGAEKNVPISY